jgi:hydrogenase maturation factor
VCATVEALVVAVEGDAAVVEWGGRRRRALTFLLPEVQPGDSVLVGLGTILGRPATDKPASPDMTRHTQRYPK